MEAVLRLVEPPPSYYEPPPAPLHSDSSRPTLGFPLGIALLLIIIFSLSGFFSCCYHWDKLRHLRGAPDPDDSTSTFTGKTKIESQSLPVIMPGDRIAKFIALPSPCEPLRQQIIKVEEAEKPPKPPLHIVVPMN
ncbi:uncharacterized protein At5g65660-like [Bidens hawaiensis]|uniref:uncharacterized protein At5g65660-like n=1 Tax=Bidens hawaiensis TaxID=980011 RepID=UPI004049951F